MDMALNGINEDGLLILTQKRVDETSIRQATPALKKHCIVNSSCDLYGEDAMKKVYAPFAEYLSPEEVLQDCILRLLIMQLHMTYSISDSNEEWFDKQQWNTILFHIQEMGKRLNIDEFYKAVSDTLRIYSDEIVSSKSKFSQTQCWEAFIDLLDELDSFRQSQEHRITSAVRNAGLFKHGPSFLKKFSSTNTKTHAIVEAFRDESASIKTVSDAMKALISRARGKELNKVSIDGIGKLKYSIVLQLETMPLYDLSDELEGISVKDFDQYKLLKDEKKVSEENLKSHIWQILKAVSCSALTFKMWLIEIPLSQTGWDSDDFKRLLLDMGVLKATRVDVFKLIREIRTDSISRIGTKEKWLEEIPLKKINWSETELSNLLLEMNILHPN